MKIAKVLMVVLAVSLCCTAVNAGGNPGDDCSTAAVATCNGDGATVDPASDATPTGPLGSCTTGGGVLDSWVTFVATDTSARIRTDLSSAGTDSDYIVYAVDQADVCDQTSWVEIGCSEDDSSVGSPWLGDISIGGLVVNDTYLIQVGAWDDNTSGTYTVDVACPTVGTVCGDGIISFVSGEEECDGDENAACEVSCETDCTCTPEVCGNGIRHGAEECDGDSTDNCLLTCEADCTCTPVPTPMLPKWGLIGLALMLIIGGAAVFGRGRMGVQQA